MVLDSETPENQADQERTAPGGVCRRIASDEASSVRRKLSTSVPANSEPLPPRLVIATAIIRNLLEELWSANGEGGGSLIASSFLPPVSMAMRSMFKPVHRHPGLFPSDCTFMGRSPVTERNRSKNSSDIVPMPREGRFEDVPEGPRPPGPSRFFHTTQVEIEQQLVNKTPLEKLTSRHLLPVASRHAASASSEA